ncbi:hypothetical protein F4781DRAFT_430788 [Annulohypoxylon bovei var. microspora]|nr:hypothetical protein F4781DRAFT_430788 [Annulohypoxylon bovei var. microspora]
MLLREEAMLTCFAIETRSSRFAFGANLGHCGFVVAAAKNLTPVLIHMFFMIALGGLVIVAKHRLEAKTAALETEEEAGGGYAV